MFNEEDDDFFPHTDSLLSTFPVCMEWIGYDPRNEQDQRGNVLAVGTMEPQIDIWDLDVIDAAEPLVSLGKPTPAQSSSSSKKKKKGRQGRKVKMDYPGHTDAVLGLSWNRGQRSLLASGSADTTVRLWDLNELETLRVYTHHSEKVEVVAWNPEEVAVLATGAHKGEVAVFDTRTPDAVATWDFGSDVECLQWCPWEPSSFVVGTAEGKVIKCSAHAPGKPVFTLEAHDAAVACLSLSPTVEGLMATGSTDEHVKVWDIKDEPSMVLSKNYDLGHIYTMQFCPDSGYQLACAGYHGGAKLVHLAESGPVVRRFRDRSTDVTDRATKLAAAVAEQRAAAPPAPNDDDDDDDDDDEEAAVYHPRARRVQRKKRK